MDREDWWATVHGVSERVRHDLGTKQNNNNMISTNILHILLLYQKQEDSRSHSDYTAYK